MSRKETQMVFLMYFIEYQYRSGIKFDYCWIEGDVYFEMSVEKFGNIQVKPSLSWSDESGRIPRTVRLTIVTVCLSRRTTLEINSPRWRPWDFDRPKGRTLGFSSSRWPTRGTRPPRWSTWDGCSTRVVNPSRNPTWGTGPSHPTPVPETRS